MRELVDDGCNAAKRHKTVPRMVFNGQLITSRKRQHARFTERSEKSTRLVRSGAAVETVFSNKSHWKVAPGPITTLQPCHLPLPHDPAGKHSSFWLFFKINSLRFPLGQSKCFTNAIFTCYGQLQFARLGAWRHPILWGLSQGTRNCPVQQEPESKISLTE